MFGPVVTKAGAPTQLLRRASGKRRVNDRSTGFYSVAGGVIFSIRTSTPQLNDFEDIIILGGGVEKAVLLAQVQSFPEVVHVSSYDGDDILYSISSLRLCFVKRQSQAVPQKYGHARKCVFQHLQKQTTPQIQCWRSICNIHMI